MPELNVTALPVLPLSTGVALPQMVITITAESPEAKAAIAAADGVGAELLLVPRTADGRYGRVGTIARIEDRGSLRGDTQAIVVRATDRATVGQGVLGDTAALWVQAELVEEPDIPSQRAVELATELRAAYRALFRTLSSARLGDVLRDVDEPGALADLAGWWPDLSFERKVELLETIDVTERVELVLGWVKEALAEAELSERIRQDVSDGMDRQQREFLLRQQLQAIRKELGEDGSEDDLTDTYRQKVGELRTSGAVNDATAEAIEREIARFERTPAQNVEHGWIRDWLDTVFKVPFGERSADSDQTRDVLEARRILDEDHTGLDEVKERIVEYLAVRKLRAERGLDDHGRRPSHADGTGEASPTPRVASDTTTDAETDARSGVADTDTDDPDRRPEPGDIGDDTDDPDRRPEPGDIGDEGRRPHATPAAVGRRPGAIIALVGPPGVGKTSLGASVARALGRRFVRVALGGVRDEAEIRGHRRTYVGAQPGRLVRAIQEAGTMNPVVLLDEVDKLGADWRGDPSSALLEVLDPAQNHTFRDHYLEVDLDLSDVVFVATANVADTIPGPLLDRMELIRLDGYTEDEKVAIARDHLVDRQRSYNGLRSGEVTVTEDALREVVNGYTREAGVRGLERELGKLLRKVATRIATSESGRSGPTPDPGRPADGTGSGRGGATGVDAATAPEEGMSGAIVVDRDDVPDLLGRRRFHDETAERTSMPGVATGLAVTGVGGDVLFVEATSMPGDSGLTVTGQLGDVMKESAQIALSYVRSRAADLGIDPAAFQGRRFHVHFPAGAVPKDGPSAGITMTTALVSLLTDRPVQPAVGMTGEVTLQGRVLPIGGVKQKVLAAHRAGLTDVVLPARNEADLDDVPDAVRKAMAFHPVGDVADVLRLALSPAPDAAPATATAVDESVPTAVAA
ncbi:MAG: endopeptidase La [Acidimicrobiales bacterium]